MIQDIEKFIKSLKRRKTVTNLDVRDYPNDKDFEFYYSIIGYINKKYFHLNFFRIYSETTLKTHNTTDCKEEISKIMAKFNLTEIEK
jgi:hypothetical protein